MNLSSKEKTETTYINNVKLSVLYTDTSKKPVSPLDRC